MDLTNIFYNAILVFIRSVKWVEFQLIWLIYPLIEKKAEDIGAMMGVAFLQPGEELSAADEKKILSKCKYDKVIRIRVKDKKDYLTRMIVYADLGHGETFMEGKWECEGDQDFELVSQLSYRYVDAGVHKLYYNFYNRALQYLEFGLVNLQTVKRSLKVGETHYDLGNDLYELMLDPWLQYTCAYWGWGAKSLNEAQENKLELIAKKLALQPGMRVLDVGCGWGTLCKYLAEKHHVECVGITISEEQACYGREKCKGLKVQILKQDYRFITGEYDRVVSIGMFEHCGPQNYREFFKTMRRVMKDDSSLFLLHTIGLNHKNLPRANRFYCDYIFPGGQLAYAKDILNYTEGLFILEDWHNLSLNYSKTLKAWRENFIRNWPKIESKYGGDRFFKMWIMYLSMSKGLFDARISQVWQIVLSKEGVKYDYHAPR